VPVKDEYLGIDDELLIETVTYSLDEGSGSTSELTLVHPDAYIPEPPELAQLSRKTRKSRFRPWI
jgi:prophage tail gpP-like protein